MTEEAHKRVPGVTWMTMVRTLRTTDARRYFASNVTLDASVLDRTSRGIKAVRAYFVAAANLYDSLKFTHETVSGARTFLEWRGKPLGRRSAALPFSSEANPVALRRFASITDRPPLFTSSPRPCTDYPPSPTTGAATSSFAVYTQGVGIDPAPLLGTNHSRIETD